MSSEYEPIFWQIRAWRQAGSAVGLATVVRTWGSSPRPAGSHLAVDAAGRFIGSVSGGCIEGAVIREAQAAIADGKPCLLEFGVSDEQAWEVGLACGGRVQVFVERVGDVPERLLAAGRSPFASVTRLADGRQAVVAETGETSGELDLPPAAVAEVCVALRGERSGPLAGDDGLFVRVYAPPPRLLAVGAVHIAQALAPMAALAGFEVTVIDPRRAFASAERFPGVVLSDEWPDEAMARLAPDARTAVVTLTHDPKLDDPALVAALRSPAFYIGALGSTRTHEKRLARLAEVGLAEAAARIRAPVGLDLGGRLPAEIAVATLAEIIQARYQGDAA